MGMFVWAVGLLNLEGYFRRSEKVSGHMSVLAQSWGNLAYTDSGSSGYPVVFLHGSGCDPKDWQPVIQALPVEVRKVVVDFRGHGQSDVPVSPFTIGDLAADVVCVMSHLKLAKPLIVGHSLGGMVAMCVARGCDNVGGLILLEGWTSLVCASDAFDSGRMYGQLSTEETKCIQEQSEAVRSRFVPELWKYFWTSVQQFDGLDFLQKTELPVWEVYGEMGKKADANDRLSVPNRSNITWVWIPGAGHYLPHERSDQVVDVCTQALGALTL